MPSLKQIGAASLVALTPALIGQTANAQEFTPEQSAALQDEIRAYILDNPEVIIEALQKYDAQQRELQAQAETERLAQLQQMIEFDGRSYVGGNPEGDVTVVEFLDYNCGYCKKAHAEVKALLEADPNVRYVIKELPILAPSSRVAAAAALASLSQDDGKHYEAFSNALMDHRGSLNDAAIWGIAGKIGLDVEQLKADSNSEFVTTTLESNRALAQALDIRGTPNFVIGGEMIRGYVPVAQLKARVEEVRDGEG